MMTQFKPIWKATSVAAFIALSGLVATQVGAQSDSGQKKTGHGFERLDVNSDGEITRVEIQTNRAARFTRIDANGDGKVTSAEMIEAQNARMAKRIAKRVATMIDKFDSDDDGALSADEMPNTAARLFDRVDTDGDGIVSQEEFDTAQLDRSTRLKNRAHRAHRNDALHKEAGE